MLFIQIYAAIILCTYFYTVIPLIYILHSDSVKIRLHFFTVIMLFLCSDKFMHTFLHSDNVNRHFYTVIVSFLHGDSFMHTFVHSNNVIHTFPCIDIFMHTFLHADNVILRFHTVMMLFHICRSHVSA